MKVYIIILNHKGWKDTVECLESVLKSTYKNFQLLLVDNSPNNEDVEKMIEWCNGGITQIQTLCNSIVYPLEIKPIAYRYLTEEELLNGKFKEQLLIIKAENNCGYAAGNNIGLQYALKSDDFKYCWLLNNDTVIEPTALENAICFMDGNPKVGLGGSRLMYYDRPDVVQGIGGSFNYCFSVGNHVLDNISSEQIDFDKEYHIDYPIGASMLISKECLVEIGLLEERYFLFYEEIDWAVRARKVHFDIKPILKSIVYHKEGATIHKEEKEYIKSEFGDLMSLSSRLTFVKKLNRKNMATTYLGFVGVIVNRIRRLQFKRAIKVVQLIVKSF
ncbi:glycosyltransferase family 2 protein [Leeuwenhoekiella polynyae]|uniref:Glycosyltransferase 2-like domain-containing protein n=1 Tax=Leeuwenhoekiella polynyae TaxID=1550906 RepID=A0A4Q0NTP9_9FLAO|nr:glycosyltransferase family 2 protein [Leeuwenhoekiella polynyae]RXG14687.1 hypothetical protein DSM02_3457 [Leeuwenhoekiella polynyae]